MTDEVDPRLIALGLVPAPGTTAAPPDWETAAPPKPAEWTTPPPSGSPSEWTTPAPPAKPAEWTAPAPPPATQPAPSTLGHSGPRPLTVGDLFPGMGKFTGTPSDASVVAPTPPPTFIAPAPPAAPAPTTSFAPPAPAPPAPPTTAYAPPTYSQPVAPAQPHTPTREAPPPLPPFAAAKAAASAVVEAPVAVPGKEKRKPKPEKKERAAKAPKAPRTQRVAKPKVEKAKAPAKPRYHLPPSGVLLRGPIVMGYPEKKLQITLEQLGFRIDAAESIEVPWTEVREIKSRRGRVVVRTKGRPVAFGIPIEGISEPTLSGPLARVVKEASGGSLDLAGSSFLELQNASDSLRDHYHDEDDPLIPTVVGLVFVLAGLTITALLPDILAIATRTPVPAGAYLLDSPLAGFDPRILAAAFAGAAMLAAGVVRVAMGKAATAWARGTLRGWHEGARRPIEVARRALASLVLSPAVAAAVFLAALVLALPSTRVQTVIEPGGFHLMREIPFFDDDRSWSTVTEIKTVPASISQHFEGIAVVFHFQSKSPISTLDSHLRGGTDKQLQTSATTWCKDAGGCP